MTLDALDLLALLVGFGLGALALWLGVRRARARDASQIVTRQQLGEILADLGAAVAVVADTDEVIAASSFAKSSGLVRGSGLGVPALSDLVELARGGRHAETEIDLSIKGAALVLGVHALPLSSGAVVLIGEDRSADLRFDQTRRDFVANITHELKTPIGAIGLLAEAAEASVDDPEAVAHFLAKLTKENRRLNDLVSQIIALSRLQADDPLLASRRVDLDRLLHSATARCAELASAGEISLSVRGEPGLILVGDPDELETAVTNLVQNAIAYSEPGARVAVTSRRDGEWAEIKVSDNGIGISPADQARIFERFFRVDADRSRSSGGTGLGLSIVKHVAAAHGGEVKVWSKLGQGSTFTLRLPATQEGTAQ